MRHKVAGRSLGRSSGHRKSLYRNLVTDLLEYEKIVTTEAKAKEVRGMAEKIITMGKKGGLATYRNALSFVMREVVAQKAFSDLAERYANRPSGYTRLVKIGPRLGDNALMVQLSLVE